MPQPGEMAEPVDVTQRSNRFAWATIGALLLLDLVWMSQTAISVVPLSLVGPLAIGVGAVMLAVYYRVRRQETRLARVRSACLGAATNGKTPEEIRAAVEEAAKLLAENRRGRRVTMADAVTEFFDRLNRQGKEWTAFLDWGIPYMTDSLDTELGDFVVLGGYPSSGKTLLALQCARKIAETYSRAFLQAQARQ